MTKTYIYCNEEVFDNDGSGRCVKKTIKRYLSAVDDDNENAEALVKAQVRKLSFIYRDVRTTKIAPQRPR